MAHRFLWTITTSKYSITATDMDGRIIRVTQNAEDVQLSIYTRQQRLMATRSISNESTSKVKTHSYCTIALCCATYEKTSMNKHRYPPSRTPLAPKPQRTQRHSSRKRAPILNGAGARITCSICRHVFNPNARLLQSPMHAAPLANVDCKVRMHGPASDSCLFRRRLVLIEI